jgi:hypothetical protein
MIMTVNFFEPQQTKWQLDSIYPLKVVPFNANGTGRKRHGLNKHLLKLHIDVTLLSKNSINLTRGPLFQITSFIGLTTFRAQEVELPYRLDMTFLAPM